MQVEKEGEEGEGWRIAAPVGMYNLGNTCFMSSVLQCLLHCVPLQRHFLRDVGHHHGSCDILRRAARNGGDGGMGTDPINAPRSSGSYDNGNGNGNDNSNVIRNGNGNGNGNGGSSDDLSLCLACETDRLFLESFGSAAGTDAFGALSEAETSGARSAPNRGRGDIPTRPRQQRGRPLVPQRVLSAAWRSGGMDHLAGYEQRDAHEFLQAFLDILGKHAGLMDRLAAEMRGGPSMTRGGLELISSNGMEPPGNVVGRTKDEGMFPGCCAPPCTRICASFDTTQQLYSPPLPSTHASSYAFGSPKTL